MNKKQSIEQFLTPKKVAIAGGMQTLMDDGKIKIFNGITTPEEVARISQTEGVMEH